MPSVPHYDDPDISETCIKMYLKALKSSGMKPVLVAIPTTVIDDMQRDCPWLALPLYHLSRAADR